MATGRIELQIKPYGLVGWVTALHVRDVQFHPSCVHWNLWSIKISSMSPSSFKLGSKLKYLKLFWQIITQKCILSQRWKIFFSWETNAQSLAQYSATSIYISILLIYLNHCHGNLLQHAIMVSLNRDVILIISFQITQIVWSMILHITYDINLQDQVK